MGECVDIVTTYVRAPTLAVTPDPQRYARIAEHRSLYESLDSDFRREIAVDGDGLVVEYPGLFVRSTGAELPDLTDGGADSLAGCIGVYGQVR